jgi:ribosomal protein S18 acetylase RimI-like enzyme
MSGLIFCVQNQKSWLCDNKVPMDIRLLTPDDAEAFWHLRLQALRNDPASFADSAEEHLTTTVETARDRLRKGDPAGNFVVGMFEEGKLSGTAGFYRYMHNKERHKGHIWGVYVRPESRGKGVGSALMKEIIRRARELNGLEQITLVASAKLPAQRLYKALGFESYGIEPHSLKIGSEYVDDVLMLLWL